MPEYLPKENLIPRSYWLICLIEDKTKRMIGIAKKSSIEGSIFLLVQRVNSNYFPVRRYRHAWVSLTVAHNAYMTRNTSQILNVIELSLFGIR